MSKEAIQKCVDLAKTQKALVESMRPFLPDHLRGSFRQGHVSNWLNRDRKSPVPPPEYVIPMSRAVGGKVAPSELRADLYPANNQEQAA